MSVRFGVLAAALSLGTVAFHGGPAFGQSSSPATTVLPAAIPIKYAGEAVVIERLDTAYHYNADGTGTKLDTTLARVQSEAAVQSLGVLSLPYAADTQRIEIVYLRVRHSDGTIVETPPTDAQDQPAPVTQQAPLYSDLHILQIPVRGLTVGDEIDYQVRTIFTRSESANQFWGAESFGQGVVVLERSIELRVPASIYVQVTSPKNKPVLTEEAGDKIYRWKGAQLKPTPKPNSSDQTDADADKDKFPPIAWTTFHSWAEVGEWSRNLFAGRDAVTPAIRAKADELTANAATPEAKIAALYNYVGPRIRYVGLDFGIGRLQPHEASVVMANQYGDCKDKHTLLAALLTAEGFPVSAVLIGAGIDFNEAVPSPASFNHVITLTGVPGGPMNIWLDATAEVAPFRMLSASIRDKQALVVPATGTPTVERTPAGLPFPAFTRFLATGTLGKDGAMKAHIDVTMRGDDELAMRVIFRQVTPGQWDQVSQYYARAYGFGGETSKTTADPPSDTLKPLAFHYDYSRAPYGDWDNLRIIPLSPLVVLPLVGEKKAPTEAIELGTPRTETVMSVITLPGGYSANLPEAMHVATPFARFDRTYQLITDGASQKVQTTRTLTILTAKLEVSQWPAYKKFLTDSVEQNEPWIQLYAVGRGAASGTAAAATPSSGNGSGSSSADVAPGQSGLAAELMRQAYTMLQQKDLDGARKNLDEVRALNPHQEGLWALYGFLAAQSEPKDMDEWVADMKKEIAEHPDEVRFYMALAQYYISSKHEDEGFATLRSALAHNPKETATALYLASLLNARGDYAGAEPVLRAAMAEVPANGEIKIQLGTTLMHEGHFDDGEALLRDVLANTNDAGQLNDAAYELADGGFDLPLAEKASRRSLELLDEETHDGETGTNALQRANLLLASWDTLGWILYREDKEPEAMPWIRAAWQNGLATEPGYHYGVLLEREHRQAEALKIYTLASGGRNGENQSAIQKLLKNRIAGLQSAGVKTEVENASTELQRIRSYHLKDAPPATPGDKGWAVFEFAISNDAPMLVSFISGDEALQGFTTSLAKLDLQLDMPKASHALLLRRGVLSCHTGCDLVLVQPDSIGSAQ